MQLKKERRAYRSPSKMASETPASSSSSVSAASGTAPPPPPPQYKKMNKFFYSCTFVAFMFIYLALNLLPYRLNLPPVDKSSSRYPKNAVASVYKFPKLTHQIFREQSLKLSPGLSVCLIYLFYFLFLFYIVYLHTPHTHPSILQISHVGSKFAKK